MAVRIGPPHPIVGILQPVAAVFEILFGIGFKCLPYKVPDAVGIKSPVLPLVLKIVLPPVLEIVIGQIEPKAAFAQQRAAQNRAGRRLLSAHIIAERHLVLQTLANDQRLHRDPRRWAAELGLRVGAVAPPSVDAELLAVGGISICRAFTPITPTELRSG